VSAKTPQQIVKRPIVLTEKGSDMRERMNQLIFEVDRDANKIQIKGAIQTLFNVTVLDVNTMIVVDACAGWARSTARPRTGRRRS
jgi:large subunit ribosomal protein L23